ncbi:polyhydroxyalkanoate synthesis regulator DNA-binding domain-containing protein [Rhodocaloribacter sp.]
MKRIIKRYENRKLYDTGDKAYVSLADIAALVRRGETVQVLDKKTGDDLTAQTLIQIILEEGKQGRSLLPTDLLHDLLRRSESMLDAGVEQIRHSVDDLLQTSMDRLNRFFAKPRATELEQLRAQLGMLERMLGRILERKEAHPVDAEEASET